MRFLAFKRGGSVGLAARRHDGTWHGLTESDPGFPGELGDLVKAGAAALEQTNDALCRAPQVDIETIEYLPPFRSPGKIVCIGLNYADHAVESGFKAPEYPAVFVRFNSSLVGHNSPIIRPKASEQLDFEGELVAVIGKAGRHIPKRSALQHVAGYSLFNDASIRDFQFKSGQWTMGKNFDSTGAFGPTFVTADELPEGCRGLKFETHLNGMVVQRANIDDLIFDVAALVSLLSEAFTLLPGDLIVTGTPSGVGLARKPPLWMKPGDLCVITANELGELRNPIIAES
jgi:2-keto-4-pentenoate hydratase/2-oxohepta-3-ene-1,7-dioic acid hydratase in catechol pathway